MRIGGYIDDPVGVDADGRMTTYGRGIVVNQEGSGRVIDLQDAGVTSYYLADRAALDSTNWLARYDLQNADEVRNWLGFGVGETGVRYQIRFVPSNNRIEHMASLNGVTYHDMLDFYPDNTDANSPSVRVNADGNTGASAVKFAVIASTDIPMVNAKLFFANPRYGTIAIGGNELNSQEILTLYARRGPTTGAGAIAIGQLWQSNSGSSAPDLLSQTGNVWIQQMQGATLRSSGAAVTIPLTATLYISSNTQPGTGMTLTDSANLYIGEASGAANNHQLLFLNGSTAPTALADHVSVGGRDAAATDARLYIQAEQGSAIAIGNNTIRVALAAAAASEAVNINGSNDLHKVTSSMVYKEHIGNLIADSRAIYQLRPKSWVWGRNTLTPGFDDWGLIAEEAHAVHPKLAVLRDDGSYGGIRWDAVNTLVLREVQKHEQRLSNLEERISALEGR